MFVGLGAILYGTSPITLNTKFQPLTTLSDLRINMPLEIVETFNTCAPDCVTVPVMLTEWRTIWLNGTGYAADGVPYTWPTNAMATYTFHNLFLTALNPGDTMTQV